MSFYFPFSAQSDVADFAGLIKSGNQPRGWWQAPASGGCRGMERQRRFARTLRDATAELPDGSRLACIVATDGAAYARGKSGQLLRLNPTKNKHQRRDGIEVAK